MVNQEKDAILRRQKSVKTNFCAGAVLDAAFCAALGRKDNN
jgi:hypothetical protein